MRRNLLGAVLIPIVMFAAATAAAGAPPERWVKVRSAHFVVVTDSGEKEARKIASQFERMHAVFHTLLPAMGDDSGSSIMVLALKDRKGMQALEPEAYLGKGRVDLAGFFLRVPEKNYILVRLDAQEEHPYAMVYHEYTHYMMRKADGWLPLWLNEGLAQFYENTDIDEKNAWLGQGNGEALRCLRVNTLLPIGTLLTVDTKSPYYHDEEKGSIFYAESWALTHFLIVSDRLQSTHRMRDYAELLARGEDAVTAAQQAFGDLDKLQAALSEYVAQRRFMYFMMPAVLSAKDEQFAMQPVSGTEVDALRAEVLAYTGRTWEAQALLEAVLRDDPDNVPAHETMGLLRYRDGDIAGAKKWYGEAVKLAPHSYLAAYHYAAMMSHDGNKDEDEAIESNLRTSIGLNPQFAPAYDALAMFYASRHQRLDEAHTLNVRAVELEPARLGYRLDCADVLTEKRQYAEALDALRDAMKVARTRDEFASVESRMERLERAQTALAVAFNRAGN